MLRSMHKKVKNKWVSPIGFMVVGIVFILLPIANRVDFFNIDLLHIIIVLAFIIGFAISLVFIPSNATIQIETSESMRGRMYGLLSALIGAVSFLPVVLAGGFADLFGVGAVIGAVGVLMVILSVCYLFLIKF